MKLPETVSDEWSALQLPLDCLHVPAVLSLTLQREARLGVVLPPFITTQDSSQISLSLRRGDGKHSCNLLHPTFKPGCEGKSCELLSIINFHEVQMS